MSALELGYAAAYLHARRHWHVQPSMLTHIMQGPLPPRLQSRSALRFNAHHVNGELLPTVAHAERHVRRSAAGGARVRRQVDAGGLTNYGQELHAAHRTWKIGTMVAANSGKPGGACGGEQLQFDKLHAGHCTQEEDIISNWFCSQARITPSVFQKLMSRISVFSASKVRCNASGACTLPMADLMSEGRPPRRSRGSTTRRRSSLPIMLMHGW